jgi:hypothetical protein
MTDIAEALAELPAEVGEALAAMANAPEGEARDQAAEQAANALLGALGLGSEMRVRAEAVALQRQALAKLREADQAEHITRLASLLAEAEQQRRDAATEAETLTEATAVTLGALRHAQDQHQAATDHYRECQDAVENAAMIGDTPQVQTELIVVEGAARRVLDQFADAVVSAERAHAQAVADAAEAHQRVKAAKLAEKATRDAHTGAERHPDRAPRSVFTLSLGMTDSIGAFSTLTDAERATLRNLVADLAQSIGADRAARAESRQAGYNKGLSAGREEGRLGTMGMTQHGGEHVLPPGVGRRR